MKYRIKRIGKNIYFRKHLGIEICQNCWVEIGDAKAYSSDKEARQVIKQYKLKKCGG